MFKKISCLGLSAIAGLILLSGCVVDGSESGANATVETQTETFIDPDAKKENALGLIFGMPQIDDRLDYPGGDREDWRYIIVAEQGVMSVTINVDKPSEVDGGWNIIDSEGRILHRQSFSKNEGYYEFKDFPVKRGVYYFQVFATGGKSIYTIATSFRPTAPVVVEQPPVIEEDEPDPEPKQKTRSRRSKKDSDDEAKPAKSKPKAEKPAASTGKTVKGFIALITIKPDGSAEVTIRNAGKDKGVEVGKVGKIVGTNVKIEMTQCFPTACRALIPASANPKSLKKGADVIVEL